jgi:hypothetical protein
MDFFVEGYDSTHFSTSNLEFTFNGASFYSLIFIFMAHVLGLYYDTMLGILYDESGFGVADAMEKVLRLFEPRERWEQAMKQGPKLMR